MYVSHIMLIIFKIIYFIMIKADLAMIILVAMNGEQVEGLVMQMKSLMAGLLIDLLGDIIMGFLVC